MSLTHSQLLIQFALPCNPKLLSPHIILAYWMAKRKRTVMSAVTDLELGEEKGFDIGAHCVRWDVTSSVNLS